MLWPLLINTKRYVPLEENPIGNYSNSMFLFRICPCQPLGWKHIFWILTIFHLPWSKEGTLDCQPTPRLLFRHKGWAIGMKGLSFLDLHFTLDFSLQILAREALQMNQLQHWLLWVDYPGLSNICRWFAASDLYGHVFKPWMGQEPYMTSGCIIH